MTAASESREREARALVEKALWAQRAGFLMCDGMMLTGFDLQEVLQLAVKGAEVEGAREAWCAEYGPDRFGGVNLHDRPDGLVDSLGFQIPIRRVLILPE